MLRSLISSALRSGAGAGATRSSGYGSRGSARSTGGFGARGMGSRGMSSRGMSSRGRGSAGYPSARGGSVGGQVGGQVARAVLSRLTRGR